MRRLDTGTSINNIDTKWLLRYHTYRIQQQQQQQQQHQQQRQLIHQRMQTWIPTRCMTFSSTSHPTITTGRRRKQPRRIFTTLSSLDLLRPFGFLLVAVLFICQYNNYNNNNNNSNLNILLLGQLASLSKPKNCIVYANAFIMPSLFGDRIALIPQQQYHHRHHHQQQQQLVRTQGITTTQVSARIQQQQQQQQQFRLYAAAAKGRKTNPGSNNKKGFGSSGSSSSGNGGNNDPSSMSSSVKSTKTVPQLSTSSTSSASSVVISKKEKERMIQSLQKQYGGLSSHDIARGTQINMEKYIQNLPQHVQTAITLYTTIQQYNTTMSKLSIYEQMNYFTVQQQQQIQFQQQQLDSLYHERNMNHTYIHNVLQQMTWDTSAYAKYVNSIMSSPMKQNVQERIIKACSYLLPTAATKACNTTTNDTKTKYLDVGCGYGAIIPILCETCRIQHHQVFGIDISNEMIKYAQQSYPLCTFVQDDFIQYAQSLLRKTSHDEENSNDNDSSHNLYNGIIFCSSLHDMPNRDSVIEHAISILASTTTSSSRLVIVHAQGAQHVQMQHTKNPILVPQLLPTTKELQQILQQYNKCHPEANVQLIVEPADVNSIQDNENGYLAVIEKTSI